MKPSDYNLKFNNNSVPSELINHTACPNCRSKGKDRKGNNLATYRNADGRISSYCFSCGYTKSIYSNEEQTEMDKTDKIISTQQEIFTEDVYDPKDVAPTRGITVKTLSKYGVQTNDDKHVYPFYNKDQALVGIKNRIVSTKQFFTKGSVTGGNVGLFGSHLFPKGSNKDVVLCEGELDSLSAYQLLGERIPCVSINNGAAGAVRNVKDNYEYLDSFENIYLCLDNDEDGRNATDGIADLFPAGKVKVMNFPEGFKDANDVLTKSEEPHKLFFGMYKGATTWTPDGIICSANVWGDIIKDNNTKSVPYPWESLNKITYGIRGGELVTLTAGTGSGKSLVLREIAYHLLNTTKDNIGMLFLEESLKRTAEGLLSIHLNKPLHLPDTQSTYDEKRKAYDDVLGGGRVYFFNHFGSTDIDNIVSRVRYMAKVAQCKYVFLDHISIVVSAQTNGDERKALDEVVTKLRTLVQETGISLFEVSHLKRTDDSHEEGGATSLSHLRGSQSIAQLSDFVLALERNQQDPNPKKRNTSLIRVLKNRLTGETGLCTALYFDRPTFRLQEVPLESVLTPPDEHGKDGKFSPLED